MATPVRAQPGRPACPQKCQRGSDTTGPPAAIELGGEERAVAGRLVSAAGCHAGLVLDAYLRLAASAGSGARWVRAWYRTPFVDRYAHVWMWHRSGWDVLPPGVTPDV